MTLPPSNEIQAIDVLELQLRALIPAIDGVRAVLRSHDGERELEDVIGECARWLNRCSAGQLVAALHHLRAELESPR